MYFLNCKARILLLETICFQILFMYISVAIASLVLNVCVMLDALDMMVERLQELSVQSDFNLLGS